MGLQGLGCMPPPPQALPSEQGRGGGLEAMYPGKAWAGEPASVLLLIWSIRLCRIEFDFFPPP